MFPEIFWVPYTAIYISTRPVISEIRISPPCNAPKNRFCSRQTAFFVPRPHFPRPRPRGPLRLRAGKSPNLSTKSHGLLQLRATKPAKASTWTQVDTAEHAAPTVAEQALTIFSGQTPKNRPPTRFFYRGPLGRHGRRFNSAPSHHFRKSLIHSEIPARFGTRLQSHTCPWWCFLLLEPFFIVGWLIVCFPPISLVSVPIISLFLMFSTPEEGDLTPQPAGQPR
jgi:hypothetical protein